MLLYNILLTFVTSTEPLPIGTGAPDFTFAPLAHAGCWVWCPVPEAATQPWLVERGWKGKPGKTTPAHRAGHQHHRKAKVLLCHSLPWVSPCAHCCSEGLTAFQRGDLWQSESPCLCKGVVRQRNWASSLRSQACPAPCSHPHSSLVTSFWIGFLTNQQTDHVYCANRWRAELIQWAEQQPATGTW